MLPMKCKSIGGVLRAKNANRLSAFCSSDSRGSAGRGPAGSGARLRLCGRDARPQLGGGPLAADDPHRSVVRHLRMPIGRLRARRLGVCVCVAATIERTRWRRSAADNAPIGFAAPRSAPAFRAAYSRRIVVVVVVVVAIIIIIIIVIV